MVRRLAVVTAAVCSLVGCAPLGLSPQPPAAAHPGLLGPAPPVGVGADQVTLLRSGEETFASIRSGIDGARHSVHVEMYEFNRRDLATSLIDAHSRGVSVSVIDDPSESSSAGTDLRLREAGIEVLDYPVRRAMIDHVKLLVIDGITAIVGGINWGSRSAANHDYDALLRGPVVRNLDRVFARDLVTCGRHLRVPEPVTDPAVRVATTLPGAEIRPLALDLLDQAHASLQLELFDLTDTSVVRALEAANGRGVAVQVLLDPGQSSSMPSYDALLAAGVAVRMYRSHGELLHAKAAVADGATVLFGSANWTGGGFTRNHELDVEIPDAPVIAEQMAAQMALDWAASA